MLRLEHQPDPTGDDLEPNRGAVVAFHATLVALWIARLRWVPVDATAFPHRFPQYDFLILGQMGRPGRERTQHHLGAPRIRRDDPHLADAVYVNNLGTEGTDRVRAAYGSNRLGPSWVRYASPRSMRFQ